jgi:hypothetical protein
VPANRISGQVRQEILRLAKETYPDYNDCHFTEELAEQPEPIAVSRSMLRRIRRAAGKGSPRKRQAAGGQVIAHATIIQETGQTGYDLFSLGLGIAL